jgi:hypothetical protein
MPEPRNGRPEDAGGVSPRTWLVIGDKPGDNAQIALLASALGWPCETRRLAFLARWQTGKPRFRPSLDHLDRARSDPLVPPWPDLILTIGRRPSMAALWIAGQAAGHTRLVIIGRPRRFSDRFDLILAPPQYRVPDRPNVLRLRLPLLAVDPATIAIDVARWQARLAPLPRPLTAVFVGGPTGPFRFDADVARDFVDALRRTTGDIGSLFVSTSRRTPDAVVDAIATRLPPAATLYRWRDGDGDNPYKALLGLADRFVVTGDSASMLVEVANLGRPLAIYRLPERRGQMPRLRRRLARLLQPEPGESGPDRRFGPLLTSLGDWLYDRGLVLASREFDQLYRVLVDQRLAEFLGQPFVTAGGVLPDDLARATDAIRTIAAKA